jgi:hypothetical protein
MSPQEITNQNLLSTQVIITLSNIYISNRLQMQMLLIQIMRLGQDVKQQHFRRVEAK